jgi:hypothetical protein
MAGAGYSGTPLAKKLGIQAEQLVVLHGAPKGFRERLGELPPGVRFVDGAKAAKRRGARRGGGDPRAEGPELVHFFTTEKAQLERALPSLAKAIFPDAMLWISWPKKSSGVATDVTEDRIRELALPLGLVDVKVCAVDDTWSALKLVWRKSRR